MEGPIETDNLDVSNQPKKEEERMVEAREHVRGLLRLMIDKMGIDIPESEWPQVGPVPENLKNSLKTSAYDSANNAIYIYDKHLESGLIYAEEIGHFIRAYICRVNRLERMETPAEREAVGEFFGRLGENIARESVKGTELEFLFKEEERNHLQDEKLMEVIKKQVDKLRPLVEDLSANLEQKKSVKLEGYGKLKDFYKKIEQAIEMVLTAQAQDIPLGQIVGDLKAFLVEGFAGTKELINFIKSIKNGDSYPRWANALTTVIRETTSNLGNIGYMAETFTWESSSESYQMILDELDDLKNSCDFQLFQLTGFDWELIVGIDNKKSQLYHLLGYAAAEYFMANNQDWGTCLKEIFSYSDKEAFGKYLENKGFIEWAEKNKEVVELLELVFQLEDLESDMSIPVEEEETGLGDEDDLD